MVLAVPTCRLTFLIAANLAQRKRQRGFYEAQLIASICLLQALGGECPLDMSHFGGIKEVAPHQ